MKYKLKIYLIFLFLNACRIKQASPVYRKEIANTEVQINYFNAEDTFSIKIIEFIPFGGCGLLAGAGNFIGTDISTHDTIRVLDFCDNGYNWKLHVGDTLKVFKDVRYDTPHSIEIPVAFDFDKQGNPYVPRIYYYPYKTTFGKIQYIEKPERKNEKTIWDSQAPRRRKLKRRG